MRALTVGRFQPFHIGHLQLVKHILESADDIIIGIGSALHSHTVENPFTAGERHLMMSRALEKEGISNYYLVPIVDINQYSIWVAHVRALVPSFDVVYTNNPLSMRLFKEQGFQVRSTPLYDREVYSGELIRKMMCENDESWMKYVPKEVARTIEDIDGLSRIREISKGIPGERLQFSEGKQQGANGSHGNHSSNGFQGANR